MCKCSHELDLMLFFFFLNGHMGHFFKTLTSDLLSPLEDWVRKQTMLWTQQAPVYHRAAIQNSTVTKANRQSWTAAQWKQFDIVVLFFLHPHRFMFVGNCFYSISVCCHRRGWIWRESLGSDDCSAEGKGWGIWGHFIAPGAPESTNTAGPQYF